MHVRLEVVRRARLDVREHRLGVFERFVPAAELVRDARELAIAHQVCPTWP